MIPTYTTEFRKKVLEEFISFNLIAFLIYKPSLGLTDAPNEAEITARRNLTMMDAAAAEIGSSNLNGYARQIIKLDIPMDDPDLNGTSVQGSTEFLPSDGDIGPFTHIVVARGVDLRGIFPSNGNNRGNNTGTVVFVEPIINSPLIIAPPYTFKHTFKFALTTKPLARFEPLL